MRFLLSLFRCQHDRTSFPQTTNGQTTISCLQCGARLAYNWAEMRIEKEIR